jgi:hypothetical protein
MTPRARLTPPKTTPEADLVLRPGGPPPALLALGEDVVAGRTEWVSEDSPADIASFAQQAVDSVNLWMVGRRHEIDRLERSAGLFLGAAEEWMERHSGHPWEQPQPSCQVWVGAQDPAEGHFEPPSRYVGHAYIAPRRGGFWTTTAMEGWPLEWFLSVAFMRGTDVGIWELGVRPGARVFEIREPDDWVQFVRTYPALVESEPVEESPEVYVPAPVYLPDWDEVVDDWDGVRWTMFGKLRTLSVPWTVLDGYTILIDELVYEQTLWLRWVLDPVGEVGRMTT